MTPRSRVLVRTALMTVFWMLVAGALLLAIWWVLIVALIMFGGGLHMSF